MENAINTIINRQKRERSIFRLKKVYILAVKKNNESNEKRIKRSISFK